MKSAVWTQEFQTKFHKNFRWAFAGSTIYELTKTLHNFFLMKILMPEEYGMISSCLAFTYFLSKLADLGASTSLLPFFSLIIQSKQNFKSIILKHYLLPHLPLAIFLAAFITYLLHNTKLPQINSPHILFLIALIVLFESLRSFLRLFMYTAQQTQSVVILEVSTFLGFILSVWIPILIFAYKPTFQLIFIPHIIESAVMVTILIILLINFYNKLPDQPQNIQSNINRRMFKTKIINYLLRISRELFSTHFLTPFFALRIGLKYAGIFYFSTVIAYSLQSILKVSVGYMGNALFASLKDESSANKQQAFALLCHKLARLFIPIIIFLLINLNKLLKHVMVNDISTIAFILPLLFLFILIIDFVMSIYEQLYIAEEKAENFLAFKMLEFALFIVLIYTTNCKTPIPLFLVGIIFIKTLCFVMISINAFKNWKVIPKFKTSIEQMAIYIVISLLLSLAL